MSTRPVIMLFNRDLRLADNPAFYAAAKNRFILPLYILDDNSAGNFKIGQASRWWLHNSLLDLSQRLNNKLSLYSGDTKSILCEVAKKNDIEEVYWNRCYEPWSLKLEKEIHEELSRLGIKCHIFNGSLLFKPWQILKEDNKPYKIFTAFYNYCCQHHIPPRKILPEPKELNLVANRINSMSINELKLLAAVKWYDLFRQKWKIGEKAAQEVLNEFLDNGLNNYKKLRNYPAKKNTSQLSPYLHFGEISPNQIWYSAIQLIDKLSREDINHFLSELGWREFSYYLLYHFPNLPDENMRTNFNNFPWQDNSEVLKLWQKGQTGYPIIDAGMRELWQTGYMHNRVRMIVGSFLVKNLLLDWRHGAAWFLDCLVDADLASNSASWQWVAGCGVDSAPYFRIFNPTLQGKKFDPAGEYIRHFVPEIANLPNKYLFNPWEAPSDLLEQFGVKLGINYPLPIVDLKDSRDKALKAFTSITGDN